MKPGEWGMTDLPLIGITMGDPAGVGPEIIVKALADSTIYESCRPVVLGDKEVLFSTIKRAREEISLDVIPIPSMANPYPGKIDLIALSRLKKGDILPGSPTVEGGRAMVEYVIRAVELSQRGELAAMVTCPISKALMHQAGYFYEGHTQLISQLTDTPDSVMMLAGARLRVALVTIHCAFKRVPALLDTERIYKAITVTARALQGDLGIERPRLAVAGLNPHAGELGLFGMEDERIIRPAVDRARDQGYDVAGPLPSDTLFYQAANGRFDAVVAMYHDQGLIPLKLLHFSDAVNITLGLPIIRTSVDHGTAYDIAGTGKVDPSSLKAAIGMAVTMVRNRSGGSIPCLLDT